MIEVFKYVFLGGFVDIVKRIPADNCISEFKLTSNECILAAIVDFSPLRVISSSIDPFSLKESLTRLGLRRGHPKTVCDWDSETVPYLRFL